MFLPTRAQPQQKLTIGVLYGFRALMVLFVCNYHIWQQGWLGQYAQLGPLTLDWDFWTRSSYVFVDGMMLLSGFLLYLPYARQKRYGTPVPGVRRFYFNRLSRIAPSYLLSVLLILFLIARPGGAYRDSAARNKDVLTHLTFTFTFFRETYLYTPLNVALWTVAIEMQFYLVFPLLVRAMRRHAALTLCLMGGAGMLFRALMARSVPDLAPWINQLPAFLDVYALGMLGAMLYLRLSAWVSAPAARRARRLFTGFAATAVFAGGCLLLTALLRAQSTNGINSPEALRLSQWALRLPLALTLLFMMLAAAHLPRALQRLLDNRLMRFLSAISFNLYIWHQVLSVQIARNLFPDSLHSDTQLQVIYTLLCFSVSILVAMAATFGVEQPASRLLDRLRTRRPPPAARNPAMPVSAPDPLPASDPLPAPDPLPASDPLPAPDPLR